MQDAPGGCRACTGELREWTEHTQGTHAACTGQQPCWFASSAFIPPVDNVASSSSSLPPNSALNALPSQPPTDADITCFRKANDTLIPPASLDHFSDHFEEFIQKAHRDCVEPFSFMPLFWLLFRSDPWVPNMGLSVPEGL